MIERLLARLAFAAMVLVVAALPAAAAPQLTNEQQADADSFAANNALFILYHEMGHLLIDQLDLPVLGREEDAADDLATYFMLSRHSEAADRALTDSVKGWLLTAKTYGDEDGNIDTLSGEHSLDSQRAYQIVCLMVGSDRQRFGALAQTYAISDDRQASCSDDYAKMSDSIVKLLQPAWDQSPHGADIAITYAPPSRDLQVAGAAFRRAGVFEQVAQDLRQHYKLRHQIQFTADDCGEPNAFYDRENTEVIFCYELMDEMYNFYARDLPPDAVQDPRRMRRKSLKQFSN